MNWNEYRQVADDLSKGSLEGEYRSSVSRAYYCAFHSLERYLEKRQALPGSWSFKPRVSANFQGKHEREWEQLRGDSQMVSVMNTGLDLLRKRTWADYYDVLPPEAGRTTWKVLAAQSLLAVDTIVGRLK